MKRARRRPAASLVIMVLAAACGSQDVTRPPTTAPTTTAATAAATAAAASPRLPRAPGAHAPSLVAIVDAKPAATRSADDISDGAMLSDVDSCSTCHPDAAAQWATSAHSFASFGNPIYRVNVELARAELGNDASRHCGGCHDMPLMVDGLMAHDAIPAADLRSHSGVTCRLCHGITSTTKDGNGSYTWSRMPLDAPTLGDPASIAAHRAQVSLEPLGTEVCVTCHRGFLSPDMGDGMPVHLSGLDDPGQWRNSAYAGNGMARVDTVEQKNCIDCHMEREPGTDGTGAPAQVASHRFLGGHTWMAGMRNDSEHLRRLQAKLEGVASIDVMPAPVTKRDALVFDVVIRNLLVGHRFPGGVLDIQDTWIEVEVADARGKRIAASGLEHATNPKDDDAHVLRTLVVDENGTVLEHHEMPRFRTQIATQTLGPREAQAIRYELPLRKPLAVSALKITARLRHRSRTLAMQAEVCRSARTPEGAAFLSGAKGAREVTLDPCKAQPITLIAETTRSLGDAPAWERLYEQGMALTATISERLEESRTVLAAALVGAPTGKPRAMVLVQLAQVASKQGRVDDALALIAEARMHLPTPGPAVLEAVEADALSRVWRWEEATMPAQTAAAKAKGNSNAWVMAARCYGSVADNANALAASGAGLELAPRDPDLLRSQAMALAGLDRAEAPAALEAYDRFRSPDNSAELRISCASDSERCAREREQGHTHLLRPAALGK